MQEVPKDISTEHGVFSPAYECEYDIETKRYTGLTIIKTAEEIYQKWLLDKDKPIEPQPTETEILKQEKEILAESVYELATIIELILEGGITG